VSLVLGGCSPVALTDQPPLTILELLTFCIKTTFFQYKNDFYTQDFGMAMGSPLSPFLSNIFMEHFEDSFVQNYNYKPLIWWRYVDDIFAVYQHNEHHLNNFLNYINSIELTIKFTIEIEQNNTLSFLDILIKKDIPNFETLVYRKSTHTNKYLNFHSNHPIMIKKGVVKSLYDRAKIICNDQNFIKEKDMIKNVLIKNNYPSKFIDKCFQNFEQPNLRQNNHIPLTNLFIPYIPGMSDKIKRLGKRFNIRTVYKTENTLRSILTKTKPNNINENTKNVIYKIPCECNKFYIGETCRPLSKRIAEHKSYIKNTDFHKSNICQHAFNNNHRINWDASSVLAKETATKKRKIKESAFILLNEDNCVSSCSVNLSNTWLPLLKQEAQIGHLKIN
jgi:predicted GIY-YIG superfamily endonuclease